MSYNTLNYTEQGGAKTVIGGTLEVKSGATVTGINAVPGTGTTGHYLKKTDSGCEFAALPATPDASTDTKGLVKQAAAVADAAGDAPTKAEFNALLAALRTAGILATT